MKPPGQCRPSLELLLPLAQAYRVPLDDLVGAPEVGDPRFLLKPRSANGRTVVPLTRQPGGVQAWKIIIPKTKTEPDLKAHEGYEWLYVLSGRMRLILGDHDVVLSPGEVADFDTRVPHWFGSTGEQPVEVLSLFGSQGERMARPCQVTQGTRWLTREAQAAVSWRHAAADTGSLGGTIHGHVGDP